MTNQEFEESVKRTAPTDQQILDQKDRIDKGYNLIDLIHSHFGCSSEAGELGDALKKHIIYGQPLDVQNILEEFGDQLWYIQLGLLAIGYTMSDAMEANRDKLRIRYPEKFTEQDALERKDKVQCPYCGGNHTIDNCSIKKLSSTTHSESKEAANPPERT